MKVTMIGKMACCALCALVAAGCVKRVDNSEKSHSEYLKSLDDSIAVVEAQIASCNDEIAMLRDKVDMLMRDFTTVANPREVGSYIILTKFKDRYPLKSTGLVARIDENNRFELVAALAGGKAFQQIAVQSPDITVTSGTVPHDQALNYRTDALTTVLFSGEAADSIGALIAGDELDNMNVIFMQGAPVQSWRLPEENAKMISQTWLLHDAASRMRGLERKVPVLHEKINLLRIHKE